MTPGSVHNSKAKVIVAAPVRVIYTIEDASL